MQAREASKHWTCRWLFVKWDHHRDICASQQLQGTEALSRKSHKIFTYDNLFFFFGSPPYSLIPLSTFFFSLFLTLFFFSFPFFFFFFFFLSSTHLPICLWLSTFPTLFSFFLSPFGSLLLAFPLLFLFFSFSSFFYLCFFFLFSLSSTHLPICLWLSTFPTLSLSYSHISALFSSLPLLFSFFLKTWERESCCVGVWVCGDTMSPTIFFLLFFYFIFF